MCNTPTLKPTDHLEKSQSHCSSGNAWVPLYFKGWNLNLNVTMVRGWDFWKNDWELKDLCSRMNQSFVGETDQYAFCPRGVTTSQESIAYEEWARQQVNWEAIILNLPTSRIVRQQFLFFKNYLFSLGVVLNVYKPSTWGRLRIQGQPGKTPSFKTNVT